MATFRLLQEFGPKLLSRELGAKVRQGVSADGLSTFDFEGVEVVSHSFADGLFGMLLLERGPDFFRKNVSFKNASPDVKAIITWTVSVRAEELRKQAV